MAHNGGVDYHGAYSWDEKVTFTGEPMNLESVITFDVYESPYNEPHLEYYSPQPVSA